MYIIHSSIDTLELCDMEHKITQLKRKSIFQGCIFGFHVNFHEGIYIAPKVNDEMMNLYGCVLDVT